MFVCAVKTDLLFKFLFKNIINFNNTQKGVIDKKPL